MCCFTLNSAGRRRLFMSHSPKYHSARGFTLVELLVVIGIIALLISILLPVLSGVRKQAYAVQCMTNLRTFGQARQQYCNSNKGPCVPGRLPTGGAPGGIFDLGVDRTYRPRWYELLGEQLKIRVNENPKSVEDDTWTINKPLFLCPAEPDYNTSRNYPYGYNYQFLGNARPLMSAQPGYINYPVKVSKIAGTKTVLAADCLGTAAGKAAADRTGYNANGTHDPFGRLNKGWCLDPPRLTQTSDYADPERREPADRSGPDPRHKGKANVLFCDGHVEAMTPSDMGYVILADESMTVGGAGSSNALFSGNGTDADPPSIFGQ
jgi:prepilin-type processing-associated H-X9-DG protein/prepilin-type N-terminal cleavage/methylation domain-containing protein